MEKWSGWNQTNQTTAATALMDSTSIKTHNLEVVSSYSCLLVQKIIVTNECNAHVSPMLCRCMRGVCVSTTLKESTVISVRLGSTMCPGPLEQTRKPMPAKVCSWGEVIEWLCCLRQTKHVDYLAASQYVLALGVDWKHFSTRRKSHPEWHMLRWHSGCVTSVHVQRIVRAGCCRLVVP